ncbi:MFS transporter [Kineococcus sp. NPDC059986]|uniref:MFS transporter n=1 Tax=Kineococcus sp. NPDC059986 TaxID=3155538 RepID=UPI00344C5EF4
MLTAFFAAAAWGRVGLAATPLALLWCVHDRTGSWSSAGLATAGLAVAEALAGPQTARLVDRFGQPRVLPGLALAHAAVLLAVVVLLPPTAPAALLLPAGAAVGATLPQLGAYSAARWAHRLTPATGLSRAFAWEAVANSTAFLLGPVLAAWLASSGRPAAALAGAAALVASGSVVLALLRGSAPPAGGRPARRPRRGGGPPRGLGLPLAVTACLGVHFGALPLAVTAARPQEAAVLFGASSAGGLLAGLVLTRVGDPRVGRSAVVLALAAAPLAVPGVLGGSVVGLAAVLAAVGAAVPPVVVAAAVAIRTAAAPQRLTSAFAWSASVSAAGVAAGSAVAGQVVDHVGAAGAAGVAAAATAALAGVAWGWGRIGGCARCVPPAS